MMMLYRNVVIVFPLTSGSRHCLLTWSMAAMTDVPNTLSSTLHTSATGLLCHTWSLLCLRLNLLVETTDFRTSKKTVYLYMHTINHTIIMTYLSLFQLHYNGFALKHDNFKIYSSVVILFGVNLEWWWVCNFKLLQLLNKICINPPKPYEAGKLNIFDQWTWI